MIVSTNSEYPQYKSTIPISFIQINVNPSCVQIQQHQFIQFIIFDIHLIMLGNSKFKKEVGFIRIRSSKLLQTKKSIDNQSDDFSSFQNDFDRKDDSKEEFSPYKQPPVSKVDKQGIPKKSFSKQKSKDNKPTLNVISQETNKISNEQAHKKSQSDLRPNFTNERLQQENKNFNRQTNHNLQTLQVTNRIIEETGKFKLPYPSNFDGRNADKLYSFKSLQPKSNEKSQEQKQYEEKVEKGKEKRKKKPKFASSSDQLEQIPRNKHSLHKYQKYVNFDNENSEQLICEYNTKEFVRNIPLLAKQQCSRRAIKQSRRDETEQEKAGQGFLQTKGGICFQLDVKQFNHGEPIKKQPIKRSDNQLKKRKVDPKKEIMQRRSMARAYDQQTRHKIFGWN